MADIEKLFGKRLKEIRKQRGLSQAQLAEMLNVDEKYISRLETSTSTPSFSMLIKISNALNVDLQNLFKFKQDKTKSELIDIIKSKLENATEQNVLQIYKITENLI